MKEYTSQCIDEVNKQLALENPPENKIPKEEEEEEERNVFTVLPSTSPVQQLQPNLATWTNCAGTCFMRGGLNLFWYEF